MSKTVNKSIAQDGDIHSCGETLVFSPFNPLNKEIDKFAIESILKRYGINSGIYNINLYRRAFVHRSYVKRPHVENLSNNISIVDKPSDCLPLKTKPNERLEFLGDGVLECIVKYYLYRRFPKENEGFMTEKKIALVKNETIGRFAYEIGLHEWYIISKHAEEKKIRTNFKKLGCLFEAVLGALFLDFNRIRIEDEHDWFNGVFKTGPGFQMAQVFVEGVLEKHVDWVALIESDDNYKNILQVKIQKEFKVTPTYIEIEKSDEAGFRMGVYLCVGQSEHNLTPADATRFGVYGGFAAIQEELSRKGKVFVFMAASVHKIKKKAEQMASQIAIKMVDG